MNGHDDPGFSLLFEPDALREEERRQFYGLDEPRYPANDDPPEPPGGGDPRDYVTCESRTISNGIEILVYRRQEPRP